MSKENLYAAMLDKHGVCPECGELISHWIDAPFASCRCGTVEWAGELSQYQRLEAKLERLQRKVRQALEHSEGDR